MTYSRRIAIVGAGMAGVTCARTLAQAGHDVTVFEKGEVVGGLVIMRYGQNALDVIDGVKVRLAELERTLPEGVEVVITYDRSELIRASIATLRTTLVEEMIVVSVIIFLFLRTAAVEPFGVPTGSMAPALVGNHRETACPRCGHPVVVGEPSCGAASQGATAALLRRWRSNQAVGASSGSSPRARAARRSASSRARVSSRGRRPGDSGGTASGARSSWAGASGSRP